MNIKLRVWGSRKHFENNSSSKVDLLLMTFVRPNHPIRNLYSISMQNKNSLSKMMMQCRLTMMMSSNKTSISQVPFPFPSVSISACIYFVLQSPKHSITLLFRIKATRVYSKEISVATSGTFAGDRGTKEGE